MIKGLEIYRHCLTEVNNNINNNSYALLYSLSVNFHNSFNRQPECVYEDRDALR